MQACEIAHVQFKTEFTGRVPRHVKPLAAAISFVASIYFSPQSVQFDTDSLEPGGLTLPNRGPGKGQAKACVERDTSMVELTIIGLLVGAALGLQFRVFALVPLMPFMLAVVAMGGVLQGETASWIVGAMAAVGISVQFSYLGGAILRFAPLGGLTA